MKREADFKIDYQKPKAVDLGSVIDILGAVCNEGDDPAPGICNTGSNETDCYDGSSAGQCTTGDSRWGLT